MNDVREELLRLAGHQVENQLTERDQLRLTALLRSDQELVELYTDYLFLHGQLTWDAGRSVGLQNPVLPTSDPVAFSARGKRSGLRLAAVAASLLVLIGGGILISQSNTDFDAVVIRPEGDVEPTVTAPAEELMAVDDSLPGVDGGPHKPLELTHGTDPQDVVALSNPPGAGRTADMTQRDLLPAEFTDATLVARVDELIQKGWQQHGIEPSPVADDAEWVRRVFLTCAGRIPALSESEAFLADDSPRKRPALMDRVLASPERADYLATIWTNLLIGRTERRQVNRDKLFEFLAEAFQQNAPWIDTVGELITASGRNDQNGATNFLLAHLNNQATPATAVTARLFLGEQISCVQCHDHPFAKNVKQEDYWALNAFFKDTVRVTVIDSDAGSSRNRRSRYITCKLEDRMQIERITHFETRLGQQKAVLPKYDDCVIPADSTANRRQQLAQLLARDSHTKIARALVNRTWEHFFGFGFSSPIDDMGPHATISHPEVLDILTEAFVRSDYDIRRLSKWITSTEAWQLSSGVTDAIDMPEHGEPPLFSRVYARRMAPEQVYESIRVAIRAASGQSLEHDTASLEHRRGWVQQFARAYETDENDESLNFEGTIGQALVMMNGGEVDAAIRMAARAIISNLSPRISESETLDRIALATLTRLPTAAEKRAFRLHYRRLSQLHSPRAAMPLAIEDMMWAYLNSSEFVLVH